jgi:hypothetical protein
MKRLKLIICLISLSFLLGSCSLFWPTETFIENIIVSAEDESGTQYTITASGKYRFKITSGALEVFPTTSPGAVPGYSGWKTETLIYKNKPIEWENPTSGNPINYTARIGSDVYQSTEAEAVSAMKNSSWDAVLEKNSYVIFLANDGKGSFGDNDGDITLSIYLLE